jgi:hypothetical protein
LTPPKYELGLPARRVACAVWASMIALPILFLGVVRALDVPIQIRDDGARELVLVLAVLACGVGITLARVLPPRIPARQAGGRAHVAALTRLVVGWAMCEGVALFPLVGYLLTGDRRLIVPAAVGVLALALWFPSRARWKAALPPEDDEPTSSSSRMVH